MTVFPLIVSAGCGSSLENEALKRAKEAYKLTQLGGSYYLCETTEAESGPPPKIGEFTSRRLSKTLYELRSIRFEVSSRELSEADRLNGIEWAGWVHLKADAFRRYCPQPDSGSEPDKTWSQWISDAPAAKPSASAGRNKYIDAMMITKTKGQWEVVPAPQSVERLFSGVGNLTFKQVEQSDLPR